MDCFRLPIALLLVFSVTASALAQTSPADPVAGFPVGSPIAVHKNDGSDVEGVLREKTEGELTIEVKKAGLVHVPRADVRSVVALKVRSGHGKTKWIVIGVVAVAVVIVASFFIQRFHNEGAL